MAVSLDGPATGHRSGTCAKQLSATRPRLTAARATRRTPIARAPRPKTSSARPPRATNGPRQAQTMTRGKEGERESVDMAFLSDRARPPARRDAPWYTQCGLGPLTPGQKQFRRRPSSLRGGLGCLTVESLQNRRGGSLDPRERLRERLPVAAIQENVVARRVDRRRARLPRRRRTPRPRLRVRACHARPVGRRRGAAVRGRIRGRAS